MKAIANGLLLCCLILPISSFGQDEEPQGTLSTDTDVQSTSNTPVDPVAAASSTPSNANPAPPSSNYTFPTNREIVRFGFRGVAKVRALYGSAFSASWKTWVSDSPEEWGTTRGWGQRFGTSVIDRGINQSAMVLLSVATQRDPIYYKCACTGLRPRVVHAVAMTFMSRNRQGISAFSLPDVISPFVGPIVTRNTIYPSRYDTMDGVKTGALHLLSNAGWNVIREFFLKAPAW